jgi:hypothetical protein
MPRGFERIVARRRMHQRIDMIPHQRDETHNPACSRNPTGRAPLVSGDDPTGMRLKRTLRLTGSAVPSGARRTGLTLCAGGFSPHGEVSVAISRMVNVWLPLQRHRRTHSRAAAMQSRDTDSNLNQTPMFQI